MPLSLNGVCMINRVCRYYETLDLLFWDAEVPPVPREVGPQRPLELYVDRGELMAVLRHQIARVKACLAEPGRTPEEMQEFRELNRRSRRMLAWVKRHVTDQVFIGMYPAERWEDREEE